LIKCPIITISRVSANKNKNRKKNFKLFWKPKPQNKNLREKKIEKNNIPNLLWSLAVECSMFPHLHTQKGGRGSTNYNSRTKACDE
jgi:hypothetical protein